jgi:Ser-tRNA(Ala) deacylase AlaX
MGILIKRTVQKEVEETLEFDAPVFFQKKFGGYIGIYSAEKVISVFILNDYANVCTGTYKQQTVTGPDTFQNEISEECFNEILAKAMSLISEGIPMPA